MPRLFEISPTGDPFGSGWWVSEYERSFEDQFAIFRGDLSGLAGFESERKTRATLHRMYPGCKIRKE
jgi:hypothetical protein